MTESCHFNDKNSLGGSFCIWKGGKSVDVFEELQEHQPEAIQYAKERVERLTRDQVAVICRDSNPVTTVYELVEFLNSKRT